MTYLAHSRSDTGHEDPVATHLSNVARTAEQHAEAFGCAEEAHLAGLLHDLGKYGELFQRLLRELEHGIDHSSAGAWVALSRYQRSGIAAALAIQGHHVGLQQASEDHLKDLLPARLAEKLPPNMRLSDPDTDHLLQLFADDGLTLPDEMPESVYGGLRGFSAAAMLDVRMLFSTLVDADFTETEAHFQATGPEQASHRETGPTLEPEPMLASLMAHIDDVAAGSPATAQVNELRADLLEACLEAGAGPQGLFTLTAPTGAGKTFSMLAFALKHALTHNLRRIVMVIPYLSIIDQTVAEYQKALASVVPDGKMGETVLEDHSMAGGGDRSDGGDQQQDHSRLLAQNWDAPIIVTTSVQMLESLFANRPGRCRKLHRLASSVILFDEVQTLSTSLAVPTLATLSHLSERYGTSVVFSTATQPAFTHLDETVKQFCVGGWAPTEIVPDKLDLFGRAKRTRVDWSGADRTTSWEDLAEEIGGLTQALCIVNLKRHATELFRELETRGSEGLLHLSTSMCPAHRQEKLEEVRARLEDRRPCLLVSTQCVEAGVDLDFPVVYRAWGPLDAIAQAAGRCNRNGLQKTGEVRVFKPEDERGLYPPGAYEQAASVAAALLRERRPEGMDINDPALFEEYYRELYDMADVANAQTKLTDAMELQDFVEVASLYRIIKTTAVNVLVPYCPEKFHALADEVRETGLTRKWIRRARPHTVGVFLKHGDDPKRDRMEAVPVRSGKRGGSEYADDWFIYLDKDDYKPDLGLVTPDELSSLIV